MVVHMVLLLLLQVTRSSTSSSLELLSVQKAPCRLHERLRLDHASISSVLQSAGPNLSTVSVRDCQRLGPYKDQPSRPCPLLVKFNSSRDVLSVLSARSKLTSVDGSHLHVKNDLTKEQRHLESILLKERWSLLTCGVDRKSVRIKDQKLYINSKLHGQATPGGFCKSLSLGDVAPSLLAVANSSQPADNGPVETSTFAPMGANKPNQASKSAQFLSPSAVLVTSVPTQSSAPGDCSSSQRSSPSD